MPIHNSGQRPSRVVSEHQQIMMVLEHSDRIRDFAVRVEYSINHWAEGPGTNPTQATGVCDFIRNKPVEREESRVLPGSRIGATATIARMEPGSGFAMVLKKSARACGGPAVRQSENPLTG